MLTEIEQFDDDLIHELAEGALRLARRFIDGGFLWCVAPGRPEHARHLAVEFVHPVIMGKPALRAVSIDDPGLTSTIRSQVRPGDVVVAVGPWSEDIVDLVSRAPAWGAVSLWIGAGSRPLDNPADHLLWIDDDPGLDSFHDGRVVLLYHLLWELTHVCMEHGVELDPADSGPVEHCITCSDEALVGEIVTVGADGVSSVRIGGHIQTVDTGLLETPAPDDLVLVHAGTAIAAVDRRPERTSE